VGVIVRGKRSRQKNSERKVHLQCGDTANTAHVETAKIQRNSTIASPLIQRRNNFQKSSKTF